MPKKYPDRSAKTYSRRAHRAETIALIEQELISSHPSTSTRPAGASADASDPTAETVFTISSLMGSTPAGASAEAVPVEPTPIAEAGDDTAASETLHAMAEAMPATTREVSGRTADDDADAGRSDVDATPDTPATHDAAQLARGGGGDDRERQRQLAAADAGAGSQPTIAGAPSQQLADGTSAIPMTPPAPERKLATPKEIAAAQRGATAPSASPQSAMAATTADKPSVWTRVLGGVRRMFGLAG